MMNWLKQLLSENGGASTKRVAYLAVVIAAIFWLSFEQHSKAFSTAWVNVFTTLVMLVGSGYLGGKAMNIIPGAKKPEKDGE
jgi:hypothetical protein